MANSQIAPHNPGVFYADPRRLPIAPPKAIGFVFYDLDGVEMGGCWLRQQYDNPVTIEDVWAWWDKMNHDTPSAASRPSSVRVLRLEASAASPRDRQGDGR